MLTDDDYYKRGNFDASLVRNMVLCFGPDGRVYVVQEVGYKIVFLRGTSYSLVQKVLL